jgi:hypothetical protein
MGLISLRDLFISLHAGAGTVAFIAGALSLPLAAPGSKRIPVYQVSLLVMGGSLVVAVAVDWPDLGTGTRWLFSALGLLALFVVWRGTRAASQLRQQPDGWRPRYIDNIGFTLISLLAGFLIVGGIDLGAPIWLVLVVAIIGIVAGNRVIHAVKARLAPGQGTSTTLPTLRRSVMR